MAQKKITDLTLRSDADETCSIPADDSSQTWRITLAQVKNWMFPITTLGDIVYSGASGASTRLAGNTAAVEKMLTQTGNGTVSAAPTWREIKAPTLQKFTSGSGTYTTPAGVKHIRVRAVGGGGGGAGSSTVAAANGGSGGAGGNTTFGASLLVANGGGAGIGVIGASAVGGTASLGTGPVGLAIMGAGASSGSSGSATAGVQSGVGGSNSALGGGGYGGRGNAAGAAGEGGAGATNSGSGGGGGGAAANSISGGGGASGGFVDAIITAPAATYAYAVGAAGTAGAAGTGGSAGGAGAAGIIIVEEYYQ